LEPAVGSVKNSRPPRSRGTPLDFLALVPSFTPWIQAEKRYARHSSKQVKSVLHHPEKILTHLK
jgi:hypothetical protein